MMFHKVKKRFGSPPIFGSLYSSVREPAANTTLPSFLISSRLFSL